MIDLTLLIAGAFLAAAISGAAGFGGALLLLPLLSHTVGPTLAVPLLTMAQLVGNLSRVGFGFRQIQWRPVGLFLISAVPMAVLGALSFLSIPRHAVNRSIGAAILLFAVLRLSKRFHFKVGTRTLILGGAVTGFLSGLVGSAGPLGAAIFLSLNLPPVAYIASEATTALTLHAVKSVVYQKFLHLPANAWLTAILMGAAMILGTWVSKRFLERLHPERFRVAVLYLLIAISLQMLIWG